MTLSDGLYQVTCKGICAGFIVRGGKVKRGDCAPVLRKRLPFFARIAVLVSMLALSACTTVQYRPMALPLPARPALTPVKASAVQCLAPDAYTALVNRERALKEWGLAEEAVLKANNAKAKQ